ncbi:UDP-galactopyranose mutase [Enterovirga sp.]|uniref:UDP-galactopyranose mutase n=1 Tax=Enterovirga sp. TaxID=2026350 RepID=UPI002B5D2BFA|nr:UDP-galactopyranose mutase [Enterovirga sp.]HMO29492.1 UDP-galactopyranose mutase [Enterovirga sp.]
MNRPILVAGAGFAGSVLARCLSEKGYKVIVIDSRSHVAGNAYDEINDLGIRVHRYGPHLFHTNNMKVVEWLSRFTEWLPYEHRVSALLPSGKMAPLPINRRTLELVFGKSLANEEEAKALLASVARPMPEVRNARDYLLSQIGEDLTDLFFAPYTRKMWGYDLSEMDASVVKRIPISYDDEDRYFPHDGFQAVPKDGYTRLIENVLDHSSIDVYLSRPFEREMLNEFDHAFLCLPIDEFFCYSLGPLPYRSIRFHHASIDRAQVRTKAATVNRTDNSEITRSTYWHLLPGHDLKNSSQVTVTSEEPCSYEDNGYERYYPIKTSDDRFGERYRQYVKMAQAEPKVTFIGRCGTYQYLDMHQVVSQTIAIATRWIEARA